MTGVQEGQDSPVSKHILQLQSTFLRLRESAAEWRCHAVQDVYASAASDVSEGLEEATDNSPTSSVPTGQVAQSLLRAGLVQVWCPTWAHLSQTPQPRTPKSSYKRCPFTLPSLQLHPGCSSACIECSMMWPFIRFLQVALPCMVRGIRLQAGYGLQ